MATMATAGPHGGLLGHRRRRRPLGRPHRPGAFRPLARLRRPGGPARLDRRRTHVATGPLVSARATRHAVAFAFPVRRQAATLEHGLWSRLAGLVMRRPVVVLVGSAAVLLAAATPALWLQLTPGSVVAIPQNIQSARALSMLRDRIGPGVITPIEVVLDAGAPGKADAPAISAATLRLAHELLDDPEVFVVAIGSRAPYVDSSGRYRQMIVVGRHDFGQEATQLLVHQIRSKFLPAARFPPGLQRLRRRCAGSGGRLPHTRLRNLSLDRPARAGARLPRAAARLPVPRCCR